MNTLLKMAFAIAGLAALLLVGLPSAEAQQPLYITTRPQKQELPTESPSTLIDLTNVPPATSVEDANDKFDARAATAIHQATGAVLSDLPLNSDDYGQAILANWAYKDYFKVSPEDSHRSNTIQSLLRQQPGQTGTDGDYDFLLNLYLPLLYKYYSEKELEPVREHIINQLLNVRGPLTLHESDHYFNRTFGVFFPETENHLLLIETARYLTNQLLYQRTHDRQFDNRRNGNGNDPQATAVWLLFALQGILQHDFLEYNAKSYQDQIMKALLNLASYAYDDDVRLAARMGLDYISAKVAVSSNDLRRSPPFRRRNEESNWGPVIRKGFFLRSPLLKAKSYDDAPDPHLFYSPDPQGAWYAMLAGNTTLLGNSATGIHQTGNFGLAMVVAGLTDYRVPAPILDLFVTPLHQRFYQRFHHGHVIPDVGAQDSVDELYAGSPSYLITAGGHPADFAYRPMVLGFDSPIGDIHDLGVAMPTTFMPADSNLTLDHMVQFGSYANTATNTDPAYHMCVAPDFACGCPMFLPEELDPEQHPNDENIKRDGNWTFINRGSDGSKAGYFLAVYRMDNGNNGKCGFLEAYDTWLHPGSLSPLTFESFQRAVKTGNPSVNLQFGSDQVNTYVTFSGQQIKFTMSLHSDIVSTSDEPEPPGYKDKFTHGTILDSQQGSGIIVIRNPALGSQITLDMHDVFHPTRTSESGKVERAGFDIHEEVWVDFNSPPGVPEEGDVYHPVKSLAAAQNLVAVGGTIKIMPGSRNEPNLVLKKSMTIKAVPGPAVIGR